MSTTGWQVYRLLRAIPDPDGDIRAAMFSVLGVAVGGGALIVLGLTMMLPINHRPLGWPRCWSRCCRSWAPAGC